MSKVKDQPFYLKLSVAERLKLVGDIWESIVAEGANIPLTKAQKAELQRRARDAELNPDDELSAEEVDRQITEKLRRLKRERRA
jgi:putative addiction module component (TIGR02574 family)